MPTIKAGDVLGHEFMGGGGCIKSVVVKAIRTVKQDPYDHSGYDDYYEKTKMPKRFIEDLEANIRMGRLAKAHPFWHKKTVTIYQ